MAQLTQKTKPKQDKTETIDDIPSVEPPEILEKTNSILDEIDKILDEQAQMDFNAKASELTEEMVYTLADAIREGSMFTEQKIGGWADAQKGETCALSAAYFAVKARGLVD